jgi:hypothetical protein
MAGVSCRGLTMSVCHIFMGSPIRNLQASLALAVALLSPSKTPRRERRRLESSSFTNFARVDCARILHRDVECHRELDDPAMALVVPRLNCFPALFVNPDLVAGFEVRFRFHDDFFS